MADKILTAEVWTVIVGNLEEGANNERYKYHVVANSAAQSEKKALKLAKGENVEKPYCLSASFEFNLFL